MVDEMQRTPMKFIKPTRSHIGKPIELTKGYVIQKWIREQKLVQVMLDNCSIQNMEHMYMYTDSCGREATESDVYLFGLGPLYELLKTSMIVLSATGLDEMPGSKVNMALQGYLRFCDQFWPGHQDDKDASYKNLNRISDEQRVDFNSLPDEARAAYGLPYISYLLYQKLYRCDSGLTPEKKFEAYLYGMIHYLDVLSAFELEVMKYLFWDTNRKVLHPLPQTVQDRYKRIKDNFGKAGTKTVERCRYIAFDRAMDSMWLKMANTAEDNDVGIDINGLDVKVEMWLGTSDQKLFEISKDIYSSPTSYSSMGRLSVVREEELSMLPYWKFVDNLSNDILLSRHGVKSGEVSYKEHLSRIDLAIIDIERSLYGYFETA